MTFNFKFTFIYVVFIHMFKIFSDRIPILHDVEVHNCSLGKYNDTDVIGPSLHVYFNLIIQLIITHRIIKS